MLINDENWEITDTPPMLFIIWHILLSQHIWPLSPLKLCCHLCKTLYQKHTKEFNKHLTSEMLLYISLNGFILSVCWFHLLFEDFNIKSTHNRTVCLGGNFKNKFLSLRVEKVFSLSSLQNFIYGKFSSKINLV